VNLAIFLKDFSSNHFALSLSAAPRVKIALIANSVFLLSLIFYFNGPSRLKNPLILCLAKYFCVVFLI